jgi:hypothetical protein
VNPSVMVRKSCYDNLDVFPLDMPYAGDWYLWGLFALHHDVAFFAEPMVAYRIHRDSLTDALISRDPGICARDEMTVFWRLKQKAEEARDQTVTQWCRYAIAYHYAQLVCGRPYRSSTIAMTLEQCQLSVIQLAASPEEAAWIRTQIVASAGDLQFGAKNCQLALEYYQLALSERKCLPKVWAKYLLIKAGPMGAMMRRAVSTVRDFWADRPSYDNRHVRVAATREHQR